VDKRAKARLSVVIDLPHLIFLASHVYLGDLGSGPAQPKYCGIFPHFFTRPSLYKSSIRTSQLQKSTQKKRIKRKKEKRRKDR
jgi:hypothetical protein